MSIGFAELSIIAFVISTLIFSKLFVAALSRWCIIGTAWGMAVVAVICFACWVVKRLVGLRKLV